MPHAAVAVDPVALNAARDDSCLDGPEMMRAAPRFSAINDAVVFWGFLQGGLTHQRWAPYNFESCCIGTAVISTSGELTLPK